MEWSDILNSSSTNFFRSINAPAFKCLNNNHSRVLYILNSLNLSQVEKFISSHKTLKPHSSKSAYVSDEFRQKGNQIYTQKTCLQQAFTFYTEAIRFAPVNTIDKTYDANKNLVLGYSNRSAVLFEQGLFEKSLEDIQITKFYFNKIEDYSTNVFNLIFKLMVREKKCLVALKKKQALSQLISSEKGFFSVLKNEHFKDKMVEIESRLENFRLEVIKETTPSSNEVFKEEKKIENKLDNQSINSNFINTSVEVKFSPDKGRHCVSNCDISPGEVLFVEKPYSAVLLPEFTRHYCHSCFKQVYNDQKRLYRTGINAEFCQNCVEIVYCSTKCRIDDKSHSMECHLLTNLFHNLGIAHLAYRIVVDTESAILDKYSMIEKKEFSRPDQSTLMAIDYRNSNDYHQVYYLMTHEESTHCEDLFKYALTSILLAKCYFISKPTSTSDLSSIGGLILRHILQLICNSHAITCFSESTLSPPTGAIDSDQVRFATAIYPRVSLLNHSCDSNVLTSFNEDSNVIVVKASRRISSLNEVSNSYGPHHLKMSLYDRRQALLDQYHFKCNCSVCVQQESQPDLGSSTLACRNCYSRNTSITQTSKLTSVLCSDCLGIVNIGIYKKEFDSLYTKWNDPNKKDSKTRDLEAVLVRYKQLLFIDKASNKIDFTYFIDKGISFGGGLSKFIYLDYVAAVDALSRVKCSTGQTAEACELLQGNIANLEFVYENAEAMPGDLQRQMKHVELVHEIFKLAEVESSIGRWEKALYWVEKSLSIGKNFYPTENKTMKELSQMKEDLGRIIHHMNE